VLAWCVCRKHDCWIWFPPNKNMLRAMVSLIYFAIGYKIPFEITDIRF